MGLPITTPPLGRYVHSTMPTCAPPNDSWDCISVLIKAAELLDRKTINITQTSKAVMK